jgi:hypothetical protein
MNNIAECVVLPSIIVTYQKQKFISGPAMIIHYNRQVSGAKNTVVMLIVIYICKYNVIIYAKSHARLVD